MPNNFLQTYFQMNRLLLSFTLLAIAASLFAQNASLNMTQLGHIAYPNNDLSNIWGYVAPDGTEYAIIGTEMGVSIVNLAVPTNPVEVQFLTGIQTIWREVKTFSHYAYISNEGGDGLRIIDLANLPGNVTYKDTIMRGIETIHSLSEADGYLYLNGTNIGNGGLQIFNLNNDPWRPQFVGEYTTRYVHDCYIRNDIVYAGEINDGLLAIIDATNKANPFDIATHSYTNSFTHNTWLNAIGDVCFTTDEKDAAYVYAWDITDLNNITQRDRIRGSQSNGASIPHNIHVLDDYGVTSYYKDGVVIFDVSHPDNMVEVAYYDTSPQTSGGGFAGCWGIYPYLPSGIIIASDIENGLYVLAPTYQRACYLEGTITDANTSQVISGATITLVNTTENSLLNGHYAAGTATAGTYQVTYSKTGYLPQTLSVSLTNGMVTTQDVQLVPASAVSIGISVLEAGTNIPIEDAQVFMTDNLGTNYTFTTDATGNLSQTVMTANYNLIIGQWGYVTTTQNINILSNTNTIIYLYKGYYDDFSLTFNWVESGNAPRGNWEKGEPVGTDDTNNGFANPEYDVTNDIGDQAFVTGNGGGGIGDDDVDQGETILTSPSFDLTNYMNPIIRYNWWFFNEDFSNQGTPNDHFTIEITNGGTPIQVKDYATTSNQWNEDSIVINGTITPTANMQIILRVKDATPGHICEAAFDKFSISGANIINALSATQAHVETHIYPNPSTNAFTFEWNLPHLANKMQLEIYNVLGEKVSETILANTLHSKQMISPNLSSGIYTIKMIADGKVVSIDKWVKL